MPRLVPTAKIALSPSLMVALDAARAGAAVYVVIHHIVLSHTVPAPLTLFRHFGHQAVIIFFLLSGFVIFANERQNIVGHTGPYSWRRLRRIYPPMLGAMAVSAVIAWADGTFHQDFSWTGFFATLFMQQDIVTATPGTIADPFMGNDPLWSLSYEFWFYLLFPLVFRPWLRWPAATTAAIGAAAAAAYALYILKPNHMLLVTAYFPIWWLGAMIADAYGRGCRSIVSVWPACLGLAAVSLVALIPALLQSGLNEAYPVLQVNHLASALIMAIVLFGPAGRIMVRLLQPAKALAKAIAPFSYGLYVMHYPLLVVWPMTHRPGGIWLCLALLLPLAWIADAGSTRLLRPSRKAAPRSPATTKPANYFPAR